FVCWFLFFRVVSRFREGADGIAESKVLPAGPEPVNPVDNGNGGDDSKTVEPPKPVTPPTHINIRQLQIPKNWSLKDENDVDAEMELLKRARIEALERNNKNIN